MSGDWGEITEGLRREPGDGTVDGHEPTQPAPSAGGDTEQAVIWDRPDGDFPLG